jgi:transposase-like protein
MTPEKIAYAMHLLGEPDCTVSSIAKLLGISRSTLYKVMTELIPAQRGPAVLEAQLAQLPPDSRPGPPTVTRYDQLLTAPR